MTGIPDGPRDSGYAESGRPRRSRRGRRDGILAFDLVGLALVLLSAPLAWYALDVTRPAIAAPSSSTVPQPTPTASAVAIVTASPAPTPTALPTPRSGSGLWAKAAGLDKGRWSTAIDLLQDGRVLLAGGTLTDTSKGATASAKIFDPTTRALAATHDMNVARAYPMSVALLDGRVLVAGGSRNGVPLNSAEVFDPKTETWTSTPKMTMPRTHGTATLLKDGRVLVAGGGTTTGPGFKSTTSAEIYDPVKRTWTATAPMRHARSLFTATLLPDGRVLVAGGADKYHDGGTVTASAEIYDPASATWSDAAPMSAARYTHDATLLKDGTVLVAGGWSFTENADPSLASTEIYDPKQNTWTRTGDMTVGRGQFRVALLPDGRVLAAGGVVPSYAVTAACDVFNPATGKWTPTGSLPEPNMWPAMITLPEPDARVLLVGGAPVANAGKQSSLVAFYTP